MSLFDQSKPIGKAGKFQPYYRVYVINSPEEEYDHDPGCTIEAVGVGNTAHYVVKNPNGQIEAMYPFSSVEAVELVDEEQDEE